MFRSLIHPCTLHRYQHQTLCQLLPRPVLVPLSDVFGRAQPRPPMEHLNPIAYHPLGTLERPLPVGLPVKFIIQPTSRICCIDTEEIICHGGDVGFVSRRGRFLALCWVGCNIAMAETSTTEVASMDR